MRAWFRSERPRRFATALAALALTAGGASIALGAGAASAATTTTACTAADITWTSLANGATSTTVTLKTPAAGATAPTCSVSLNSYSTSGPSWQTSDPQAFLDHMTVTLSPTNTSATLSVKAPSCYGQTDLYGGDQAFDGTPAGGPLPDYANNVVVPLNLLESWNGGSACATPVAPTVTDAVCTGSAVTPGTIVVPSTGATYAVFDSANNPVTTLTGLAGGTYTVTATAPTGTIFVAGSGYTLNTDKTVATFTVTISSPSCGTTGTVPPPVTTSTPPPTVSFTPPSLATSCVNNVGSGTFTVPSVTGVIFTIGGTTVTGVQTVAAGSSVTLVATAVSPYTFTTGQPTTETLSVPSTGVCAPVVTGTPPTNVLGETVTKPTTPTAVLPVAISKPTATLPFTGLPEMSIALVGLGLIGGGSMLVLATRRRKAGQTL